MNEPKVPERINVCIRAGKEDWVSVAYADETADPSAIHEYVAASILSSRDAEIKEVLEGLRGQFGAVDCWCDVVEDDTPHLQGCPAAHALYSKLSGGNNEVS